MQEGSKWLLTVTKWVSVMMIEGLSPLLPDLRGRQLLPYLLFSVLMTPVINIICPAAKNEVCVHALLYWHKPMNVGMLKCWILRRASWDTVMVLPSCLGFQLCCFYICCSSTTNYSLILCLGIGMWNWWHTHPFSSVRLRCKLLLHTCKSFDSVLHKSSWSYITYIY